MSQDLDVFLRSFCEDSSSPVLRSLARAAARWGWRGPKQVRLFLAVRLISTVRLILTVSLILAEIMLFD